MDGRRDARVDEYISTLPGWQAELPHPDGLINQSHDNATARAIQFREGDVVNEPARVDLFRAVKANNRAGGWRKRSG